jgi:hypothetical protein
LTLLFIAACSSLPRDADETRSTASEWSAPVALTAKAAGAEVYPDLALADTGSWVADFTAVRLADPGATRGSPAVSRYVTGLRIRTPDGRWIEAPPGNFTFAFPRIATAPPGTLHVLWAEPADRATDSISTGPLELRDYASVWHAEFQGTQWSAPEQVYRGGDIEWDPVSTSRLIVDAGGALHLAFAAVDSAGRPRIVHLRSSRAGWSHTSVGLHAIAGYVDANAGSGERLVMAFATVHHDSTTSRANTIFVARSADGGRTWTDPVPITRPEQGPAYEPRLARGRGDTLHLAWTQSDPADPNESVALWHTVSTDDGASWGSPLSSSISGMTHQLQAAAAPCGGLHVIYADFTRRTLVYARLSGTSAAEMQTPFGGIAGNPVLRMDSGGMLHLVWMETTVASPDEAVWQSRLVGSTLRAC